MTTTTIAAQAVAPAQNALRMVNIGQALGVPELDKVRIPASPAVPKRPGLFVPAVNPKYVWTRDLALSMTIGWMSGERVIRLLGVHGTGKTDAVLQWHAHLGLPLYVMPCNPRTEASALISTKELTAKGSATVHGLVTRACTEGVSLLLDEVNLVEPGELIGLNAIFEGKPFTVPDTGETVQANAGTRFFLTMNKKGVGLRGRSAMDISVEDRMFDIETTYLPPEVETASVLAQLQAIYALASHAPDPATLRKIAEKFVASANAIRDGYVNGAAGGQLSCTMSSRMLERWVRVSQLLRPFLPRNESAVHAALRNCLTFRLPPHEIEAVHQVVDVNFEPRSIP